MDDDFKNEFKEFLNFLREKSDYLLSHHPICDEFDDDYYHVGDKRLCVGCFTAYPIAISIIILWRLGFIRIETYLAFLMGLLIGSLQFLSLTRVSEIKIGKISIKVLLGIGIGFFTIGIFSLSQPLILRVLLFFICMNIAGFFSFLRMKKIKKTCEECKYEKDWDNCPGFDE